MQPARFIRIGNNLINLDLVTRIEEVDGASGKLRLWFSENYALNIEGDGATILQLHIVNTGQLIGRPQGSSQE